MKLLRGLKPLLYILALTASQAAWASGSPDNVVPHTSGNSGATQTQDGSRYSGMDHRRPQGGGSNSPSDPLPGPLNPPPTHAGGN